MLISQPSAVLHKYTQIYVGGCFFFNGLFVILFVCGNQNETYQKNIFLFPYKQYKIYLNYNI